MDTTIEGYHLSPQQRRLWSLLQDGAAYNATCTVEIDGSLEQERLIHALASVVRRHEILRTHYQRVPGRTLILQVVAPDLEPVWRDVDLRSMTQSCQQAELNTLDLQERQRVFDLAQGPLLYATLLRLDEHAYRLVLTLPALCADSSSLNSLVNEIHLAYIEGTAFADREEPFQYVQFSEWQNEVLETEGEAGAAAYLKRCKWTPDALKSLAGVEAGEDAAASGSSTASIAVPFSSQLTADLEAFAGESSEIASVLLACWIVLNRRRMRSADVTIGMSCDGRKYEELQETLGVLAKWMPVACNPDLGTSFAQLLQEVQEAAADATESQTYFGPEKLTGPEADTRYFPYGFSYEADADAPATAAEITFTLQRRSSRIERSDLLLACRHNAQTIEAEIEYDPQSYPTEEIQRLAQQFQTLVQSAIAQPDAPLHTLNLLPSAQRQQLVEDWNQTHTDYPPVCVHTLFEQHAANTPDAPALAFEGATLTYRQLDRRANQLAHLLQARGVAPGSLVALCLERSHQMIVGLLAILKAGAAYVPLDPAYPHDRLHFVLQDSQAPLVLTQNALADRIAGYEGEVVLVENLDTLLAQQPDTPPQLPLALSDLAYVIYTSGSTGMPKGVLIEHGGLSNYVQALLPRLGLPTGSRFASVSTLAADLGNTVVFGALCSGGCLHVLSAERATDAAALGAYFTANAIDCLKIVPSHLSALLSEGSAAVLPRLVLVLGGEACPWGLVDRVHSLSSTVRIVNHYGPTETTVGVLTYEVSREEKDRRGGSVPLGRPLDNTQMYVLDGEGSPVPIGVVGELYVGGSQVARGYLQRPELTLERFCEHSSVAGSSRLYRTGDLVWYRGDGNLVFVGRGDDQIKIRGYRVELGEIESVLRGHGSVREAVVLGVESGEGLASEKRLVGYVVSGERGGSGVSASDLRSYLEDLVPEYMIPSGFVWLEQLPLSPNGKIDRQALLKLDIRGEEERYTAPRTPTEEALCAIWTALLGLERVGIHDNFFLLGGHSLLATQVVSRVRTVFDVDIAMRTLFEKPTVAELATAINTTGRAVAGMQAPAILPASRDQAIPLSFSQQRLWFIDQLAPGAYLYNVPVALRLRGILNVQALQSALNELVRRHEVLRTTFPSADGKPIQVIGEPRTIPLPMVDLSGLSAADRDAESMRRTMEEAQRPFDLAHGPVFRAGLLHLDDHEHILLLTLHHIVSDGWSKSVLFRELGQLYADFSAGRTSSLPDLPIQYADYSVWQRDWLQGAVLEEKIGYWRAQLAGAPSVLELPTDRPRTATQTFEGGWHPFQVSEQITEGLLALNGQEETSLFMTLLAAFNVLLWRYTGQEDLLVGTDVANRNQQETEGLIGFLLNHIVLRTHIRGNLSFRELLRQVRETALAGYEHQDLPFDKLVEALRPERSPSHTPLFQVLFVLQNVPRTTLSLPGLQLEGAPLAVEATKFDLALFMQQKDQIQGGFQYRKELFDAETMTRMCDHFQTLLASIVADPDTRLDSLEMQTEAEREQLRQAEEQSRSTQSERIRSTRRKAE